MTQKKALYTYTLRLADDALILGHRLGEWCGKGPILEEDLALSNLALDMIGRAESLLRYAAQTEGKNRTEDDLAYKRGERQFYNHLLYEFPNTDFAYTMVRHLFISTYESILYEGLMKSSDPTIAAIAAKSIKEIHYHFQHAKDWCVRLGDGTIESHKKMQTAVNNLWMYTGELFEIDEIDERMTDAGIAITTAQYHSQWKTRIIDILSEAKLIIPEDTYIQTGGRSGLHTEHLGHILAEMQYLPRAYPDAIW